MPPSAEELATPVSRAVQLGLGVLALGVAVFFALMLWANGSEWLLVPATRELSPNAALCVACVCGIFIWFFAAIAYRTILNRPNREGGLFSSTFLYAAGVITLVATLTIGFIPSTRIDRRARTFLYGLPMSGACWLLARRRAAARRSARA